MDTLVLDCTTMAGTAPILGEFTQAPFAKKVALLSFSHSLAQPGLSAAVAGSGHTVPVHQALTVTKNVDLSTPAFIDSCNQARPLATVKLMVCSQSDNPSVLVPYLTYVLSTVFIISHSITDSGSGKPVETIVFSYRSIEWDYKLASNTNPVAPPDSTAKWNCSTNSTQ